MRKLICAREGRRGRRGGEKVHARRGGGRGGVRRGSASTKHPTLLLHSRRPIRRRQRALPPHAECGLVPATGEGSTQVISTRLTGRAAETTPGSSKRLVHAAGKREQPSPRVGRDPAESLSAAGWGTQRLRLRARPRHNRYRRRRRRHHLAPRRETLESAPSSVRRTAANNLHRCVK